ncbi:hypothetical protein MO973_35130 [Paenibacillus sp. TRM 82003]|uniref:hypothetical protein n=1 Tax=Kineococcus sp. TRM81007 TaxID=2925831 RepID=UPI001F5A1737|nr:hypothetical protein [Kineococcus sp. TRM81007]MCI2240625.1 hypothetical protein [Kineococcus sp. TRM81007]MCI3925453.1 hypothetical protein [Paenibacillus sp. TRM 82003]
MTLTPEETAMPSTRPSLAACLVLQGTSTPPALEADLRDLVRVADEVVVYDTADHVAPGTPAFAATLHPAVTVVSGFWADDRERAKQAALAHVEADWALCVLPGEKVHADTEELRRVLGEAGDAPALAVRVDDVVRGTHRSARLLHKDSVRPGAVCRPADGLAEVPSRLLTVEQPVATTASVPRQRGVFDRV